MLVQFVADTLFKTLVAVPVVGGLVLVALVVGGNPLDLLRFDDLTQTISAMVGVLLAQPVALAAFAGRARRHPGRRVGHDVRGQGRQRHGAAGRRSLGRRDRSAAAADVGVARGQPDHARAIHDRRADACSSRYLRLGIALTVVYAIIGAAYIALLFGPSISQALDSPLTVTLASLSVLVAITLVNFLYLLMQIVMAAEDCGVLEAVPHVARLLRRRTKELGAGARGDPGADADGDRRVDSRHHRARA